MRGAKTIDDSRRIRILLSVFLAALFLPIAPIVRTADEEDPSEKFKVRVDVDEVRIDVVVLDWKGNQITDLTADDFTVLQDYVPQEINSCQYIDESMIRYKERSAGIGSDSMPERKDIQRTMLFVLDIEESPTSIGGFKVDDLKTFAENEMGPGYLAGIVQMGTTEKPLFTSNREELWAIIDNWQWRLATRGPDGFKSYSSKTKIEPGAIPLEVPFWEPILAKLHTTSEFDLQELETFKVGIRTLGYYVQTLKDMPGRKNLVVVGLFGLDPQQYEGQRGPVMDLLADEALRAGVVIHVLDPRGLTLEPVLSTLNYNILSKNTGGITVNDNWWVSKSGISWLAEEMKGYYLISYTPPPGTFDSDSDDKFHRIKVRTNGWFREVHTRSGFYSNPTRIDFDLQIQRAANLDDTLNTPFAYDDLKINLAAAYSRVPDAGYSIQSWVYMNPTEFEYEPGKDDDQKMSLETLLVVENTNGAVLTSQGGKFDINEEADLQKIREKGLSFDVKLNIENPGGYFVRVIVKDRAADRVGNAYRFLEIPDLEQGRLALSSIFVRGNSRVEIPQESKDPRTGKSNPSSSVILPVNTPAVRSYNTGDILDWTVHVYNLKKEKDRAAELKYQYVVTKNGEVFSESDIKTLRFGKQDSVSRIPITRRLLLGQEMTPGIYQLKITVTDSNAGEKYSTAVRTFDFEILKLDDSIQHP